MSSVLTEISKRKHEKVVFIQDREAGLTAVIAVHDTTLGPALGGCRMRDYQSLDEALLDALKLSEGMTFKNSLAGLSIGGGKAVIIGDRAMKEGREKLFEAYGRHVNQLGGAYITAEDMGTTVEDMTVIERSTKFVAGRADGSGDPSPHTAHGVFSGMRACMERAFGSDDFKGKHIAIQGVGNVGHHLGQMLVEAGARLTVADTREDVLKSVAKELNAEIATVNDIAAVKCDVFAPCAIGGTVNPQTVGKLNCKVVAGAANNQISGDVTERILIDRGILYAPDFAINAGGVISVAEELEKTPSVTRARERTTNIYTTIGQILDRAKTTGELPGSVAVKLAMERIEAARRR